MLLYGQFTLNMKIKLRMNEYDICKYVIINNVLEKEYCCLPLKDNNVMIVHSASFCNELFYVLVSTQYNFQLFNVPMSRKASIICSTFKLKKLSQIFVNYPIFKWNEI